MANFFTEVWDNIKKSVSNKQDEMRNNAPNGLTVEQAQNRQNNINAPKETPQWLKDMSIKQGNGSINNMSSSMQEKMYGKKIEETNTLISGGESKGYKLTDDDYQKINQNFNGYFDANGNRLDEQQLQTFNDDIQKLKTNQDLINNNIQKLTDDYKNGLIDAQQYNNMANQYQLEWNATENERARLESYQYKEGYDYFDSLKDDDVEEKQRFYNYVSSFNDGFVSNLAKMETAAFAETINTIPQALSFLDDKIYGDQETYFDKIYNDLQGNIDDIRSYTLNGKMDGGIGNYSLRTINSLLPMVNAIWLGSGIGELAGIGANAMPKFVNDFTTMSLGVQSGGQTAKQRLAEGNSWEASLLNGAAHGYIAYLVESLDAGQVTKLLTGAGGNMIGVGLFSLPSVKNILGQMHRAGLSEAAEELIETMADGLVDNLQNVMDRFFFNGKDQINLEEISLGSLAEEMIMAYAGSYLLGGVNATKVTINSAKLYNQSNQTIKWYEQLKDYALLNNDTKTINDCNGIINLIKQEQQTYLNDSKVANKIELESDAPQEVSFQQTANAQLNALRPDVQALFEQIIEENRINDAMDVLTTKALMQRGMLDQTEQGYKKGINAQDYIKMNLEQRTKTKNILNISNQLGIDVDINPNLATDSGAMANGRFNKATGMYEVNPNVELTTSTATIESTLMHEITHRLENTQGYGDIKKLIFENYGTNEMVQQRLKEISNLYEKNGVFDYDAESEFVAKEIEKLIGNEKFLNQLTEFNEGNFMIKTFMNMKTLLSNDPQSQIANKFMNTFSNMLKNYEGKIGENTFTRGAAEFSISQYKSSGRAILMEYLRNQLGLTEAEKADVIQKLDKAAEDFEKMMYDEDLSKFKEWSNVVLEFDEEDRPYFSCVVPNGEYRMNIDFSTVCKKRKVADAILNDLAKKGLLDSKALSPVQIAKLREIIQNNNLEVACSLCFVDSKRFNQGGWADTLINGTTVKEKITTEDGKKKTIKRHKFGWNDLVNKLVPNSEVGVNSFNFAERDIETFEGRTLDQLSNEELNQDGVKFLESLIEKNPNNEEGKMASALLNNQELRKELQLGDLYGSTAFENIKKGNKEFFKIVNQHQGVAKPKTPYVEVTYNNDIILGNGFKPDKAKYLGGVRIQSFSDYMANMVFDYLEMISELDVKQMPAQAYTKVKDFVELFGTTGIKINMSLIPKINEVDEELRAYTNKYFSKGNTKSNAALNSPLYQRYLEQKAIAGLKPVSIEEVENATKGMNEQEKTKYLEDNTLSLARDGSTYYQYLFDDESFDYKDALDLQTREGYSNNCGSICVGVSDEHIWKLLNDHNIKMVIPYHKSSLNSIVAHMMNIGFFNDYTDVQNTRTLDGVVAAKQGIEDFGFYDDEMHGLANNGYNIQDTVKGYLDYCNQNKLLPKFDQFAYVESSSGNYVQNSDGTYKEVEMGKGTHLINQNYYKLLIDFRAYGNDMDVNGNLLEDVPLAPQMPVKLILPSNFNDLVLNSLKEYEVNLGKQEQAFGNIEKEFVEVLNNQYSIDEDNQGNAIPKEMQTFLKDSIGDRVNPRDINSQHIRWYHGTPNANFTQFRDDAAIYLTSSPNVASTYSDGGRTITANDVYSTNTIESFNNSVKEKGYDFDLREIDGNYYLFGNGDDIASFFDQGDMDNYYDVYNSLEDTENENVFKYMVGENIESALNSIKEYAPVDNGNYQLYAKSTNPFIVDANGSNWDRIRIPQEMYQEKTDWYMDDDTVSTRDIEEWIRESHPEYDSIRFTKLIDDGTYMRTNNGASEVLVLFNPNQAKDVNNMNPTEDADIRYSIDEQNYSNAISNNDIEKAQKILDNIATKKGYTKLYHGTNADFNVFDVSRTKNGKAFGNGIYLTDDIENAREYSKLSALREGNPNVMPVYAKLGNSFTVDLKNLDELRKEFGLRKNSKISYDLVKQYINKNVWNDRYMLDETHENPNYDSVIVKNVIGQNDKPYTEYVIFDNNNVKSANTITYDDNGNTIPLSQRFDQKNNDIRYAIDDNNLTRNTDLSILSSAREMVDEINNTTDNELKVEDISNILNGNTNKNMQRIEKSKEILIQKANEWIPAYDTIREQFPSIEEGTFKRALFDVLTYDEFSKETKQEMFDYLNVGDYLTPEMATKYENDIEEFRQEIEQSFINQAKYKEKRYSKNALNRALIQNQAFKGNSIDYFYQKALSGVELDEMSKEYKQDIRKKYLPIVKALFAKDGEIRNLKHMASDRKISEMKTIDQNIDVIANGDSVIRDTLKGLIRNELLDNASETKVAEMKKAQEVIDQVRKLGINEGSKEDIAVQYFMEGHTEEIDKAGSNLTTSGVPYVKFTEKRLKEEYNYKMANGKYAWENIKEASKLLRDAYDDVYEKIIKSQLLANGDVAGKAKLDLSKQIVDIDKAWEQVQLIKKEIVKNGSKESTQAAYESAKARLNTLISKYNNDISKNTDDKLTRRNLLPYREDYTHHINKRTVKGTYESIRDAELLTPTQLAGTSDYTRPNTAWKSFMAAQEGGHYTPTSLGSFAAYMGDASDVIAYNPVVVEVRQFNSVLQENAKNNELNRFAEYLNDYANSLAGKRSSIDRTVQKLVGARGMKTIQALNSYAKAAALAFNVRSALVQFANLPNAMMVLQDRGGKSFARDVANGFKAYINKDTVINQSTLLNERYFELDTGAITKEAKLDGVANFMLSIGDKIAARAIWYSAYEQGVRLGESNPVQYADDITRSSIASRSQTDLPLAMKSQVVNLLIPFQVENNNLFQNVREQMKKKDVKPLLTYTMSAFIFNSIIKFITGGDDEVLPEFLTPIIEEIKKARNDDEYQDLVKNILWGEIGEFISMIPGGSELISLTMDSDTSDTLFGDYNPSRYGMTNIGLSGIGKAIKTLANKEGAEALTGAALDLVGGYVKGGKQATRTIGGLQSMGALPKFNADGELVMTPVNYTKSGNVSYVNDQNNPMDWVRAALFGKYSTSAARGYVDSNFKKLNQTQQNVFDLLNESSANPYQNFNQAKGNLDELTSRVFGGSKTKEEPTTKEILQSSGQYDGYVEKVKNKYQEYLEGFDFSEGKEPKTFTQFAKTYGLSKKDLDEDDYDNFYKAYNITDKESKVISNAMEIKTVQNALGKDISNSAQALRRQEYEKAGIYDDILEYIEDNGLEYSDFGLSKTVVGYNDTQMAKMMAKIEGKTYVDPNGNTSSSTGSTSAKKQKQQIIKLMQSSNNDVADLIQKIMSSNYDLNSVDSDIKRIKQKYGIK